MIRSTEVAATRYNPTKHAGRAGFPQDSSGFRFPAKRKDEAAGHVSGACSQAS